MSLGIGLTDTQEAVIRKVRTAKDGLAKAADALKTAAKELEDAVRDDEGGAKKGGRELRILAEQVLDVRLQATVLQDRLETEKTTPQQEQADRERAERERAELEARQAKSKRDEADPIAGD
jgi:hypothetical protein